jgi:peptidoglycan hydrolase-like protein with peptidoglycan-binding domain
MYFGLATQDAVRRFQCKVMKICTGGGYGIVGPLTTAALTRTLGGAPVTGPVIQPTTQPTQTPTVPTSIPLLTRPVSVKTSDPSIKSLQIFLNTHGYTIATSGNGSRGNETTYFGPTTINALARFQIAQGITPAYGNLGAITVERINQMIKAGQ